MADKFKKLFSASSIKNNYNQLLSKYRMEHIKYYKKSRGQNDEMDLLKKIHKTFPKKYEIPHLKCFWVGVSVSTNQQYYNWKWRKVFWGVFKTVWNKREKESLKEIKYNLYKSLLESETSSRNKQKKENKKLKSDMQELKDMTSKIFEILKKDKNKE